MNFRHLVIFLFISIFISSCGKDKVDESISFKIDGETVEFTNDANISKIELFGILTILASEGEDEFEITLADYTGVGTYDLESTNNNVEYRPSGNFNFYGITSGELVITVDDEDSIEGTFSFYQPDDNPLIVHHYTEGKFTVKN